MIGFFARHRTASNLLMVGLVAMGLLSIGGLRRETFPDFTRTEIQVTVIWPGATAAEVEQSVADVLEDAFNAVTHVAEIRSASTENRCVVTLEMADSGDPTTFASDVQTQVDGVDGLPDEIETPRVERLFRTDRVIAIAVTGPEQPIQLQAYARVLERRLRRLPEISQVEVEGFSDRQLRVELRRDVLLQYGLSVSQVADAIARQSVDRPAGTLEGTEQELVLRFADARRTPAELGRLIVVGGASGAEIRLGQLATIRDTFESAEEQVRWGDKRAAVLRVSKTKVQDSLRVFDAVKAFIEAERKTAPPGVEFHLTDDMASIVRERLQLLLTNGWQGLLLIFATLWLFFNVRYAFWVAMGLPVSFLAAFFFFGPLGMTLNMITIVGLLLALGLLMDDSLVIAENIAVHLAQDKEPAQAAIDGVGQIRVGIISSFLTTLVVFGPLTGITGNIGKVLRVMPIVLILVLTVSLLEAFLILPNHLSHSGRRDPARWRKAFERGFGRLTDGVAWLATQALRVRYLTLALAISAFLCAVSLIAGGTVKFRPFPDLEGDILQARLLLPQGTPLARTEAVVARLTQALEETNVHFHAKQPDGQALVRSVRIELNRNKDAGEQGPHLATISADLLSTEVRQTTIDELKAEWLRRIGAVPDVIALNVVEPSIGPAGRALSLRIAGDDLDELKSASGALTGYLRSYAGVYNLMDDLRPGKQEVRLRLRSGALGNQLDAAGLAAQLAAAFRGRDVDEVQVGGESKEVQVRLTAADRAERADLRQFRVVLPGGELAPLAAVAHIESGRAWGRIARIDGERTVTLEGDVDARIANAGEIRRRLTNEFLPQLQTRYPRLRFGFEGEAAETAETAGSMRKAMLIGILGIFLILSFQFNSYVEPLVVMGAIPFALIGVVVGHWLLGHDLSMPSMMGFISLSGVVVNDSILLVEFLKMHLKEAGSVAEAAALATRARFRAIFLTSATTILGLVPLMFERSMQAQVLIPLAISLVFGLLASTVLVLIVIPVLYTVLSDWGLTTAGRDEEAAH